MKYQEFTEGLTFGNFTAFVFDAPNSRYNYSSGEITDEIFDNVTSGTEFYVTDINSLPEVKEVIIDNFLSEIAPAAGVEDEGYNNIKADIEQGLAKVGYWEEETKYGPDAITTTVYILILG